MQTRRKGQFCFVLTLLPRLCAALNKEIFDSGLNSNNSYWSESKKIDETGGGETSSFQSARGLNADKARSTSKLATNANSSVLLVTTRVVRVLCPKYNVQRKT